jgi:hypothetical protein
MRPSPAKATIQGSETEALVDRTAEQRAAEQRAAEQRAAEQRAAEQRAAEQRAAEQRAAEQRAAEQRAAEQRAAEQRAAEQRAAEALDSEIWAAKTKLAECDALIAARAKADEEWRRGAPDGTPYTQTPVARNPTDAQLAQERARWAVTVEHLLSKQQRAQPQH